MADQRPDPDQLLRLVADEEARNSRGKLTIFFGAAPGVGKTYSMLEVARAEMEREKRDVVIGVVETHGRYETSALVLGLELLPRRRVAYRGVEVEEFDIDAALQRRPDLVVVDELAHSNAEGSRHPKRWQDVEELLDAGIDVFSTMNVQHVESLNDVITKITGIVVRETVPDSVLEHAHELKLVDLPPDDLLERLREGKVYVPAQARRAIENFFKKGNLIALRELALRHTAERVDAQMRAYRVSQGIEQTWAVTDQILVAVSPSPYSARLVRAARRMAGALHARWFAVYVEPPRAQQLAGSAQAQLAKNLRLAEQLGAEVVTLVGEKASEELLRYARQHNVTKIIVGKPIVSRPWERFLGSLVDELVRSSGDIDVYVTAGDQEPLEQPRDGEPRSSPEISGLAAALVVPLALTGVAWLLFGRDQLPDVIMIYLLGIMLIAARFPLSAAVVSTILSVAALDFVFVPPYLTFAVGDFRHVVTFAVMFVVAIVISGLTRRVRNQAAAARERERRTAALYALSRELSAAPGSARVLEIAAGHLEQVFGSQVAVYAPGANGKLERAYASPALGALSEREVSVSEWVWSHHQEAGLGTATLPGGSALHVPLMASGGIVGVLSLSPRRPERFDDLEQRRQVDAFAAQVAMALERGELAEQTEKARRDVEAEQLRSSLLSSVSHDLRTPLAVITGVASTLLQNYSSLDETTRRDLTQSVLDEAARLNRLIGNLLDMTRLESGAVKLKKEWLPLEEIVGSALAHLDARFADREISVSLPTTLPLVPCDATLIELLLINLLENAAKYSGGPVELEASFEAHEVRVRVDDRGPGIPSGQEQRVFEKFHRAVRDGSPGGAGLGLSIARAVVAAHGGRIEARNRDGGGASFRFTLPIEGEPPVLAGEPAT